MKGKYYHSVWNHINITALAFLALLIVSLLLFSTFQDVSADKPVIREPLTNYELKEKEQQLINLESKLHKKEEELNQREIQLSEKVASRTNLIGKYTKIISELTTQFSETNQLYLDTQTGSIGFVSTYLFDSSESNITEAGANFLNEFVPAIFSILLNEDNRDYISEIIIEGHGDDVGSYLNNLNLSQRRASEVANYILSEKMPNFEYKDMVAKYITAYGKSFSQPVIIDGNINKEKSRRVEFKFRLKDESFLNDIRKIIDERTDS